MNLGNRNDSFGRFGAATVLTPTLILFFVAILFPGYVVRIRAASGEPVPSATPSNFEFPSCSNVLPQAGDMAHYTSGLHQIVGGALLFGSDDVYTLSGGKYLQCFCPADGGTGIQTNWLRVVSAIQGWFFENGIQWNLGNYNYAAQNVNFSCDPGEPTPTPVATPTNDPGTPVYDGKGDGLGCATHDCSGNNTSTIEGYGTGGQVLGASTMAGTGSFDETLYQAIMSIGATLTAFGIKGLKKARKASKK